jgi:hypothetical protein
MQCGHLHAMLSQDAGANFNDMDPVMLPVGGIFDPLGLSKGTEEQLRKYQENEVWRMHVSLVLQWHDDITVISHFARAISQ